MKAINYLPYLSDGKKTLYEAFQSGQLMLPKEG